MAKLLRKESRQDGTRESMFGGHLPASVAVEGLLALLARNDRREEVTATVVPLPDAWKGPAHVAKTLRQAFPFNSEQIDILATLIWPLEEAWQARPNQDSLHLAIDKPLVRALLCGGGGCGKTTMIMKVLKPLLETFFPGGGCALGAPSNKAARLIQGKTLHSLGNFSVSDSLQTIFLRTSSVERLKRILDELVLSY